MQQLHFNALFHSLKVNVAITEGMGGGSNRQDNGCFMGAQRRLRRNSSFQMPKALTCGNGLPKAVIRKKLINER